MRQGDWVNVVAFNPDGTRLASASRDGSVKIWDLGNGREIRSYRGQKEAVRRLPGRPMGNGLPHREETKFIFGIRRPEH